MSTSTSHTDVVKFAAGVKWGWPALSVEMQQQILEQLSYRELRVMHCVCKGMRALTTSTAALRSAFFRTEVVDEAALQAVVDLPGRTAADKARSAHFWSKSEDPPPAPHPSQSLKMMQGAFKRIETCVVLHPALRSLCVIEKPKTGKNRKMNLRINDKLYWVDGFDFMKENATEPPISQADIIIGFGYGITQQFYGNHIKSGEAQKPLKVRDMVLGWADCRKTIKSDMGSLLKLEFYGETFEPVLHVDKSRDDDNVAVFEMACYHSSWGRGF